MSMEQMPNQQNQVETNFDSPKEIKPEIKVEATTLDNSSTIIEQIEKEEDKLREVRESLGIPTEGHEKTFSIQELENELGIKKESLEEWEALTDPQFDENNFYRIVNEAGYKDFVETGVVRSSPTGSKPNFVGSGERKINIGSKQTPFPSFAKGAPDLTYLDKASNSNYILETDTPLHRRGDINPTIGNQIRGGHWAYRPLSEDGVVRSALSKEEIKGVYKVDKEGNIFRKKS